MAEHMPNLGATLYSLWAPAVADDYAIAMNPGHPLLGGFDQERFDADRAAFLARVDSFEKLAKVVEGRYGDAS